MRIVLHIGFEKTGTTSIQAHCARNAHRLRRHGILYPSGLGDRNHAHLAAAFSSFEATADIRLRAGVRSEAEYARFCETVVASLREQVDRARPEVLLLSSEHFSSRVWGQGIARLQPALGGLSRDVRVLVYLRRQDEMLFSLYSTYVKSGGTRDLSYLADEIPWFHYDEMLDRWAGGFGRDRITVRIFPPKGATLIEDFAAAAGLPDLPQEPVRANRALDHRNAQLLARLNACLPPYADEGVNPAREGLVEFLEARSAGAPLGMALGVRRAFLARFEKSNEAVRAMYLPHLPTLFEDITGDDGDAPEATLEDAVALSAAIWTDRARLAARVADLERSSVGGRLNRTGRRLTRLRERLGLS